MSTKRKITPLGDRVLVRVDQVETKTKSGIIIPDTVGKERPEQGVVVEVGTGRTTDQGVLIAPTVKRGDTIIFSSRASMDTARRDSAESGPYEIKIDGEEYYILNESNILAVIK